MPSSTFYNLNIEKQNTIYLAAKKEFSRIEFSKTSINQIIKDAQIPRGSFYMYFNDKHDLFNYVLLSFVSDMKTVLIKEISLSSGDLSETLIGLHDYLFHLYEDKQNQGFMMHVMMYFQSQFEIMDENIKNHQPLKEGMKRIIPYLNKSQFKDNSEEAIETVVDISFTVLRSSLVNAFMQHQTIDVSKQHFIEYMKIIQFGYLRK